MPLLRPLQTRPDAPSWQGWRAGVALVKEIALPFATSAPAFTKHLKVREHAGLIERSRDAQRRPFRLTAAPLAEAAEWVGVYAKFWRENLDRLEELVNRLQQAGNPHDCVL